jgi:prepilin-type N-terminal cleavage/methylation domain-containing protein
MALPRANLGTVRGMPAVHPRRAFTLVELLIALALLGVGVTALASALLSDVRLRDLAVGESGAAAHLRDRMEQLAVLPCVRDTAAADVARWGIARWRASPHSGAWYLIDSIAPRRVHTPIVVEARVICPS